MLKFSYDTKLLKIFAMFVYQNSQSLVLMTTNLNISLIINDQFYHIQRDKFFYGCK
jgi:hypothetical protein